MNNSAVSSPGLYKVIHPLPSGRPVHLNVTSTYLVTIQVLQLMHEDFSYAHIQYCLYGGTHSFSMVNVFLQNWYFKVFLLCKCSSQRI